MRQRRTGQIPFPCNFPIKLGPMVGFDRFHKCDGHSIYWPNVECIYNLPRIVHKKYIYFSNRRYFLDKYPLSPPKKTHTHSRSHSFDGCRRLSTAFKVYLVAPVYGGLVFCKRTMTQFCIPFCSSHPLIRIKFCRQLFTPSTPNRIIP